MARWRHTWTCAMHVISQTYGTREVAVPATLDTSIAQHIQQRCDSTCAQVDKLVGLPVDPQTKWSVLHNCLRGSLNAEHMVAPAGGTPSPG